MLFHVSIEADDPRHVAGVIAELWRGKSAPFPPVAKGSWMAIAGDERNTTVEIYPRGSELRPAEGDADSYAAAGEARRFNATHMAIASPLGMDEVFAIAEREGWPAKYRKRGGVFGVIEFWVEGGQLIEVLTPKMQREYLAMQLPPPHFAGA